ncbi:hypothetical protein DLJ96_18955, partial [Actinotalea fermentans ATCC 43279 = JCM 9966 = DSM 3133]
MSAVAVARDAVAHPETWGTATGARSPGTDPGAGGGPVVTLHEVSRVFPGGVAALRDVHLDVHRGELLAIVGPSGSGKSTMLNVIGTL